MEPTNRVIAENLRRLRELKRLSLDRLAEVSGVSKSMLGQIERGESSPTVATVWKIATGLKVSFTALINSPQPDSVVMEKDSIEPLLADGGKYRLYPFFRYEEGRPVEMYTVEMDPGCVLSSEPHGEGTYEFITLFDGELILGVGDESHSLKSGDSIRFNANRRHTYRNDGSAVTRLSMVLYYQVKDE